MKHRDPDACRIKTTVLSWWGWRGSNPRSKKFLYEYTYENPHYFRVFFALNSYHVYLSVRDLQIKSVYFCVYLIP